MDCSRKGVSFDTKKGTVAFDAAATRGCPKPPATAKQKKVRAEFGEAARACAEPGKNPAKTAGTCMPAHLKAARGEAPASRRAPKVAAVRGRLKAPEQLDLSAYRIKSLTGCKVEAQKRAEEFCKRFSYVSDAPELAGATCFAKVRRVFADVGCANG
jgi:hypothetical protein